MWRWLYRMLGQVSISTQVKAPDAVTLSIFIWVFWFQIFLDYNKYGALISTDTERGLRWVT